MIFGVARALSSLVNTSLDLVLLSQKFLIFVLLAILVYLSIGLTLLQSVLGSFVIYLVTGGWRFVRVIYLTIGRDFRALLYLIDVQSLLWKYEQTGENVITLFQKTVQSHPKKAAMVLVDERQWTFQEVDESSNCIANFFHERGYRKGDVVALFMESRPEFVIVWLGLAKIGVISALINFNLRRDILLHSITASNAKSMIHGADLKEAVHDIRSKLPSSFALYCKCSGDCLANGLGAVHLDQVLNSTSTFPPPKDHVTRLNEKLFYIYTSGTTGMPKAAIVSHARFFYMSRTVYSFFRLVPNDIIYNVLPLYHTAGGVLSVGHCLLHGCTLVIRRKFSASRFWDDCCKYNCTAAQYIGEICRYLLAQPQKSFERQHNIRIVFGNGLRPQIWDEFQQRFNIKQVGEFYGATEGNASVLNPDNVPGAVGFQSRILPFVYPVTLLKVDLTTGLLIRNKRGFCVQCKPGEPGELVGKIVKGSPLRHFDGYTSEEASKKKMAFNVFRKGDCYFLTGDILEMDELGYMYFRDRTGDTFRWRGENVSTSEVEAVISNITKLKDAVVYGVEVPGNEGRAGMAAIVDERLELDLKHLNHELQKCLPRYARPIFIRLVDKLDMTETFKLKKTNYRRDGFNPSVVKDRMFYLDQSSGEYKALDLRVYEDICSGRIQF